MSRLGFVRLNFQWLSRQCLAQGLFLCCFGLSSSVANAQFGVASAAQAKTVAVVGEPFGVFSAEIPIPPEMAVGSAEVAPRILVHDDENRVYYPAVSIRTEAVVQVRNRDRRPRLGRPGGLLDRVRDAVRNNADAKQQPVAIVISGLFRGSAPLTVRLDGDLNQQLLINPSAGDQRALLNQWWQNYVSEAKATIQGKDFPSLIHKYLVSMLAQRLGLTPVDLDPPEDDKQSEENQPLETLSLLAAIEPLREQVFEDILRAPSTRYEASLPMPAAPVLAKTPLPPLPVVPPIEELAKRVPPECFYLRFGAFSNFVWFQDIAQRYGGDVAQAVLLRGFNYEATAKMERMLAAKMTTMAKMFGGNFVGDMALVGTDLYMKEGASLGVIFHAKSPDVLRSVIESERKGVAAKHPDATLQQLEIAGQKAILLSTPDNRIRSFFVADGNYICVTTSQTIARRFLEVGKGMPSLADSAHFQWARSWMPDANGYSVFAYFSPDFFQNLVSPQYQIELHRRLEAIAHLEVAELATQCAAAEGVNVQNVQSLNDAGFVPNWFDRRADGAKTIQFGGKWIDSTRGARGSFMPIADVQVNNVTQAEAANYARIASFYQDEWKQMDPMVFGLRRFASEDGSLREKVTFEAYISPFQPKKYGWATSLLAGPNPLQMQQPGDDVASLQLQMRGKQQGLGPKSDDFMLFAGVKDMRPPDFSGDNGLLQTLQALKATPAYIGGWPKPGLVEQLPLGLGLSLANPDLAGYSRMLGGLWRWQDSSFSLLSFNRNILEMTVPALEVTQATDSAQARLQVKTLQGTELAGWLNSMWYDRGWQSSHGNAELLDVMHQQLKVPAEQCLDETQKLLDVKLQCPLGGEFEFVPVPTGNGGWWRSSAWSEAASKADGSPTAPPNYEAPWIDWYRGGRAHLTQGENSLAVVGEIDLEMKPLPLNMSEPVGLPQLNFDVFSLPSKLFGGGDKPQSPSKKKF